MLILSIDCSCAMCQVALVSDNKLLKKETINNKRSHSQILIPSIENIFIACDKKPQDLSYIACISGPGSYTGLRIAVSTAKLLAFSLDIPLITVSSTEFLAKTSSTNCDSVVVPCIYARNNRAFYEIFIKKGSKTISKADCTSDDINEMIKNAKSLSAGINTIHFTGDGILYYKDDLLSIAKENGFEKITFEDFDTYGKIENLSLISDKLYEKAKSKNQLDKFAPANAEVNYIRPPHLTLKD